MWKKALGFLGVSAAALAAGISLSVTPAIQTNAESSDDEFNLMPTGALVKADFPDGGNLWVQNGAYSDDVKQNTVDLSWSGDSLTAVNKVANTELGWGWLKQTKFAHASSYTWSFDLTFTPTTANANLVMQAFVGKYAHNDTPYAANQAIFTRHTEITFTGSEAYWSAKYASTADQTLDWMEIALSQTGTYVFANMKLVELPETDANYAPTRANGWGWSDEGKATTTFADDDHTITLQNPQAGIIYRFYKSSYDDLEDGKDYQVSFDYEVTNPSGDPYFQFVLGGNYDYTAGAGNGLSSHYEATFQKSHALWAENGNNYYFGWQINNAAGKVVISNLKVIEAPVVNLAPTRANGWGWNDGSSSATAGTTFADDDHTITIARSLSGSEARWYKSSADAFDADTTYTVSFDYDLTNPQGTNRYFQFYTGNWENIVPVGPSDTLNGAQGHVETDFTKATNYDTRTDSIWYFGWALGSFDSLTISNLTIVKKGQVIETPHIKLTAFASTFFSAFTCADDQGPSFASGQSWSTISEAYGNLSSEDQARLQSASANAYGAVSLRIAARYDYIVGKYGVTQYADFMGRNPATIAKKSSLPGKVGVNSPSAWAIYGLIGLGVVSAAGVILLRKKKESK